MVVVTTESFLTATLLHFNSALLFSVVKFTITCRSHTDIWISDFSVHLFMGLVVTRLQKNMMSEKPSCFPQQPSPVLQDGSVTSLNIVWTLHSCFSFHCPGQDTNANRFSGLQDILNNFSKLEAH